MIDAALAVAVRAVDELGASDCEAIGDGWARQPVNTATSLAYVAVGAIVAVRWRRAEAGQRPLVLALALALVAAGAGSVAYHGVDLGLAKWLHDAGLAAVLVVVVASGWVPDRRSAAIAAGVGCGAVAAIMAVAPATSGPITLALGAGALVGEVRTPTRATARRWTVAAAALLGLGVVLHVLGRTGGALCAPDSALQGHGAWHVLTALAVLAWAASRLGPVAEPRR